MTTEERIMQRVRCVIDKHELTKERQLVERMMNDLDVEVLDYAAALLHILQADDNARTAPDKIDNVERISAIVSLSPKMIRYRLALGQKHGVSKDAIKDILVEESGVERKLIRFVDIRNDFTIVELPEGMPEDIFQHLKTFEIRQQKLDIKRLSGNPAKKRASNARRRKKRMSTFDKNKQDSSSRVEL